MCNITIIILEVLLIIILAIICAVVTVKIINRLATNKSDSKTYDLYFPIESEKKIHKAFEERLKDIKK